MSVRNGDGSYGLRLLADDLTGALDSACAFAAEDDPVAVSAASPTLPALRSAERRHFAVSTETRHCAATTAVESVKAAVAVLSDAPGGPALWFKKVDSVLRGSPVAETVAVMDSVGLESCVFAPAFPEQGRVTANGRQFVRTADGEWRQAGPDLVAAFADHGRKAVVRGPGDLRWPSDASVLVVDARTPEELRAAVDALRGAAHPRLWAGAGGLAEELGLHAARRTVPPLQFIIVGTNHPATTAQVTALAGLDGVRLAAMDGGAIAPPAAPHVVLAPSPALQSAEAVDAALERSLPSLIDAAPTPEGLFVTGGETLSRVLAACGADRIDCTGRIGPGIPAGRIAGGVWDGVPIVTKSGGFGGSDLLVDLVRRGRSAKDRPQ